MISDCKAFTALTTGFDVLNAIDAGAVGDLIGNRTATGGDVEDSLATIDSLVDTLVAGSAQGVGSYFLVTKTLAKTAILTTGVDVTGASAVGAIEIVNAYVQNDANDVTTATLIELYTDNDSGSAAFFSAAIAALQASEFVRSEGVVLESTKKVLARATGAHAAGTGNVTVYLICRRLVALATLAAAA
jgi:hypothetical protein